MYYYFLIISFLSKKNNLIQINNVHKNLEIEMGLEYDLK